MLRLFHRAATIHLPTNATPSGPDDCRYLVSEHLWPDNCSCGQRLPFSSPTSTEALHETVESHDADGHLSVTC